MFDLLVVMNDMIVIVCDLLLYTIMCPSRENTRVPVMFKYIGCVLIVAAYYGAVYILKLPAAVSSTVCMTVPSFLLFLYYAKYRDSRFVLTFCFIDTISLIVAFIGRLFGITLEYGEVYAVIIMPVLFAVILRFAFKYADTYKKLLAEADAGWGLMACSTALIYFAMIFFAGYPKPMVERVEYFPVWLVFAVVVISCYVVFIHSIFKTQKISDQKKRLEREKEVYQLAYNDGLTGLHNRASYMEKVNELERNRSQFRQIGFVVVDINCFKQVNDTMGHHMGDQILIFVADALRAAFKGYEKYIFRMGGDEFFIILPDEEEEELKNRISGFRRYLEEEKNAAGLKITAAVGYEIILTEEKESLEHAFVLADRKMYEDKRSFRF